MMTALVFALFFAALVLCLVNGASVAWALLVLLAGLAVLGLSRGFSPRALSKMALSTLPKSMIVLRVLFYIGLLTGLWRTGGTIAFFIYHGVRLITPQLFVLVTFLLSALLSYALGTSFGVASTAGVVMMALARSGGVSTAVTAGAVLSGIYFGDRGAPTSSCACLVAALTETELYGNVRRMFKTAALPYAICLVLYSTLSVLNPITVVDETLLKMLTDVFDVSWYAAIPAALMLLLPLAKVPIRRAILASAVTAFVLSVTAQGVDAAEALRVMILGYAPEDELLARALSGGGLISMKMSFLLIPIASMCTGILEGIGLMQRAQELVQQLMKKSSRLAVMNGLAVLCSAILCNQAVVVLATHQLSSTAYREAGASGEEHAMDIANTSVLIAGLVPWNIACAIPLSMLGVGVEALPYGALLYLIPLCYLFTKKFSFPQEREVK